jgi:hypothetical protein
MTDEFSCPLISVVPFKVGYKSRIAHLVSNGALAYGEKRKLREGYYMNLSFSIRSKTNLANDIFKNVEHRLSWVIAAVGAIVMLNRIWNYWSTS